MANDSLAFANFATGYEDAVLTPASMQRMFGDQVCKGSSSPCKLTLSATAFMNRANKAMNGGRCEGFAVMSSLVQSGKVSAEDFGGTVGRDLVLAGNPPLQRELAYWFSTQLHPSVAQNTKGYSAKDVMPRLVEALSKDAPERFRIGIVKKVGGKITGGHALTPIGFQAEGTEGVYLLRVYDNNVPDTERTMRIDTRKNRWEYEASENPSRKSSLYFGDDTNKNPLYFAPVFSRTGEMPCHFCDGKTAQVTTRGGVQALVKLVGGGAVGVADGELQAGDGTVTPSFSAQNDEEGASFIINVNSDDVNVDLVAGDDGTSNDPHNAGVEVLGADYAASVGGLTLVAGDSLAVSRNGRSVDFTNGSHSSLVLDSAVNVDGRAVTVSATLSGSSDKVAASIDEAGVVLVEAKGSSGAQVIVTLTVETADGGTSSGTLAFTSNGDAALASNSKQFAMTGTLSGTVNNDGVMMPVTNACEDRVISGMESDVDCGGTCSTRCDLGQRCNAETDCRSSACNAVTGRCVQTRCEDGARSADESDVDCGGTSSCARCTANKACATTLDCANGLTCEGLRCLTSFTLSVNVTGLPSLGSIEFTNATTTETLTVSAAGVRAFPTRTSGAYSVSITQQPFNATCVIMNGAGTATADVVLQVTCSPTHAILGSLTGLAMGQMITLQNNGGDALTLSADGSFVFPTRVAGAYAVTVQTQPSGQTCTVTDGSGTATGDVTNVAVSCTSGFTIGGGLSGLQGGQLVTLQNNGGDALTLSANGPFSFATRVPGAYAVTVQAQPSGQRCTVSGGSGTATADVTTVAVSCVNVFTIGGVVAGLPVGRTLTLQNGMMDPLVVMADGAFTFAAPASAYDVTVFLQPTGASCVVTNGTGTATANVTNVQVACLASGVLDVTFNMTGAFTFAPNGFQSEWFSVVVNPDDSQLWVGRVQIAGADEDWAISKLTSAGAFDPTFGSGGTLQVSRGAALGEAARAIHRNADGTYLVAGTVFDSGNLSFAVARVTAAGALDATFGTAGIVIHDFGASNEYLRDMAVLADGSIVLVGHRGLGTAADVMALKLTATGALDTLFGTGGRYLLQTAGVEELGLSVAAQSVTGDLFVGGSTGADSLLISLNSLGAENPMFGTAGVLTIDVSGATQPDAITDLVVSGISLTAVGWANQAGNNNYVFAEFNSADGSNPTPPLLIDRAGGNDQLFCLAPDPTTGGFVAGGRSGLELSVLRFTNAGVLDTNYATMGQFQNRIFNPNVGAIAYAVALDGSRRVVAGGMISGPSASNADYGAVRLTP